MTLTLGLLAGLRVGRIGGSIAASVASGSLPCKRPEASRRPVIPGVHVDQECSFLIVVAVKPHARLVNIDRAEPP